MSPAIITMKNKVHLLLLSALLAGAYGCQKNDDGADLDVPLEICGIDGMRLEAHVDGSETCFSTSLFGNQVEDELSIGGINPTYGSIALLLNDLSVGSHVAADSSNQIILIAGGAAFQSTSGTPGSITITAHDEGANRIKGSFSANVVSADGSPSKTVSGSFDVIYLEL